MELGREDISRLPNHFKSEERHSGYVSRFIGRQLFCSVHDAAASRRVDPGGLGARASVNSAARCRG